MPSDQLGSRRRAALAALLALSLALGACGGGSGGDQEAEAGVQAGLREDETPTPGGTLVFGLPAETNGWNPATNQWADAGNFVGSTMFDPLAVFTPDGSTEPYLAETIEPVEGSDFKQWVITVPEGVEFHNGEKLDGEVVRKNLEFTFTGAGSLSAMAVGPRFESVEATGPYETTITFNTPWSLFPASLAGSVGYMLAPAMIDSEDNGSSEPIGTGPYVFSSWNPDVRMEVVRNDDYWGERKPLLDRIEFQVIKDDQARAEALRAGQIEIMLTNSPAHVESLSEDHTVVKDYDTEQTFAMFNTAVPPFDNEHARRAVALATDRDALIEAVGPGLLKSDSPTLDRTKWKVEDPGWLSPDLEEARKELALYLEETGEEKLSFTFSGMVSIDVQQVMQILQSQWAEIGIEVQIDAIDQTTYITTTILGQFQLAYFRNYGYPVPDSDEVFWHSSTALGPGNLSINFTQYATPEIDAALEAARSTDDPEEQARLYAEVVRARNAAVVDLWLHSTPAALVAGPRVRGLGAFAEQGFANYVPKPWVNDLWLQQEADE